MFFVLNAGRSGSRTVAQVLSQAPSCTCLHEPDPQLVEESFKYRAGELAGADVSDVLRTTRHEPTGDVYGETANKLALVVPPLRAAFPDAALVWLVRDGRAMVSSGVQRGWYGPEEDDSSTWARYRPTAPLLDGLGEEAWDSWDQFERMCWYWARINSLIRQDTEGADVLTLRLEDLQSRIGELADHVGVQRTAFTVTHANRRYTDDEPPPADAKRSNRVTRRFEFDDWTDAQRKTFEDHCGPLMDELYPDWREATPTARRADEPNHDADHVLVSVREELAELRLGNHEVRDLRRERDSLRDQLGRADVETERLNADAARLHTQLEQTTSRLAEAEQGRQTAERGIDTERRLRAALADDLAAATRRHDEFQHRVEELSRLLADRDTGLRRLRERTADLEQRLATETERRRRLTSSFAYRFASLLTRLRDRAARVVVSFVGVVFRVLPRRVREAGRHVVDVLRQRRRRAGSRVLFDDVPRLLRIPGRSGTADGDTPVIALLLWDAPDSEVRDAIAEVRSLQAEAGDFGPIFVTDTTHFHLFRAYEMVFEYVPPREEWISHFPAQPYEDFVSHRVARLMQAYHPDQVVNLDLGPRHRASSLATLRACVVEVTERRERRHAIVEMLQAS